MELIKESDMAKGTLSFTLKRSEHISLYDL